MLMHSRGQLRRFSRPLRIDPAQHPVLLHVGLDHHQHFGMGARLSMKSRPFEICLILKSSMPLCDITRSRSSSRRSTGMYFLCEPGTRRNAGSIPVRVGRRRRVARQDG